MVYTGRGGSNHLKEPTVPSRVIKYAKAWYDYADTFSETRTLFKYDPWEGDKATQISSQPRRIIQEHTASEKIINP